jgi:6-phosphogluconolactonase
MISAFATRDAAMAAAAQRMADALQQGIAARGHACAALSGGATPGPAYEILAKAAVDWSKVTLALVDERFVPPSDPGSNERLIRQTLALPLARGARFAPMYAPSRKAAEAAMTADALYRGLDIDIALMGMGEDGHTASWFPGAAADAALNPAETRTVIAVNAPGARGASERLTLTYAAIKRARALLLLITGEVKRDVLQRTLDASPGSAPMDALIHAPVQLEVIWAP